MVRFPKLIYKKRNQLNSDIVVCIIPLKEWVENSHFSDDHFKIKVQERILPFPLFAVKNVLLEVDDLQPNT